MYTRELEGGEKYVCSRRSNAKEWRVGTPSVNALARASL